MKICDYHRQSIRTALSSWGLDVRNDTGPSNPAFTCEALILRRAIETEPGLVDTEACPICTLIVPSWIESAAQATYAELQSKEDHQTKPN